MKYPDNACDKREQPNEQGEESEKITSIPPNPPIDIQVLVEKVQWLPSRITYSRTEKSEAKVNENPSAQ